MNIGTFILTLITSVTSLWSSSKTEVDNILTVAVDILSKVQGSLAVFLFNLASRAEADVTNLNNGQPVILAQEDIAGVGYTTIEVRTNSALGAYLGIGTDPNAPPAA